MKKKIYIEMGERLDKACRALGIEKKDIAKELGITAPYLTELCKGNKTNPGIKVLYQIAKHYRVSIDYLLLGEGDMFLPGNQIDKKKLKNFEPVFNTIEDLVWVMKQSSYLKNMLLATAVRLYIEGKDIVTKELLAQDGTKENNIDE